MADATLDTEAPLTGIWDCDAVGFTLAEGVDWLCADPRVDDEKPCGGDIALEAWPADDACPV